MKKIYVIRKYILASNMQEALRLESNQKPDDCWCDDDTHKGILSELVKQNNMGFKKNKQD